MLIKANVPMVRTVDQKENVRSPADREMGTRKCARTGDVLDPGNWKQTGGSE